MDLEQYRLYDTILCIDLKSFFASVECVERGKDPMTYPLLVADKTRGNKTIVLAVTPYLKSQGVPSRCRLYEVEAKGNLSYEIASPRMSLYLKYSYAVVNIYLKYVSIDDMYIYSVDESFLDLTNYMALYKKSAREVAQIILDDIHETLGLTATVGIGQNMIMSKLALDIDAKKMPDFIAEWSYKTFQNRLWKVNDLTKVWGIGSRKAKRLHQIGIHNIYQLAMCHPDILYEQFGIMGHELFLHAHCIDVSKVQDKYELTVRKGYNVGQTLFRDYYNDDVLTILYEQCQDLSRRLRADSRAAQSIAISISYSKTENRKGVHTQKKMLVASCEAKALYDVVEQLFRERYEINTPVRRIGLSVTKLIEFRAEQPSMFDTMNGTYHLDSAIDRVNQKFGLNAILTGRNYGKGANQRERNKLIGGHKA